jgi:hypothetical protein
MPIHTGSGASSTAMTGSAVERFSEVLRAGFRKPEESA